MNENQHNPLATNTPPQDDPWAASTAPADTASAPDPWSTGASDATTDAANASDWLSGAAPAPAGGDDASTGLAGLWQQLGSDGLPVQGWINDGLAWLVEHFRPFFQTVRAPIDATLSGITDALLALPWPVMVLLITLLAWQFAAAHWPSPAPSRSPPWYCWASGPMPWSRWRWCSPRCCSAW